MIQILKHTYTNLDCEHISMLVTAFYVNLLSGREYLCHNYANQVTYISVAIICFKIILNNTKHDCLLLCMQYVGVYSNEFVKN